MTFLERLQTSFAQLGSLLPALIGALVILFAGYLLAKLVQRGTERVLRRIQLNRLLERGGVLEVVERSGTHANPTRVIARLLFWFIMIAVILLAANALGLESLGLVFTELVGYIPSIIAAVVIIIIGILLGDVVGGLITASAGTLDAGPTLARVGRGGVIVIAVLMALQQLGVETNIVTTAFAIIFGAIAFALALAFGLGNRELAGEVTRAWYERYRAEREAIEREVAEQDKADAEAEAEAERAAAAAASARRAARAARGGAPTPLGMTPVPGTTPVAGPPGAPGAPPGAPPAAGEGVPGGGTPADRRG